jgi:hypothetical protein
MRVCLLELELDALASAGCRTANANVWARHMTADPGWSWSLGSIAPAYDQHDCTAAPLDGARARALADHAAHSSRTTVQHRSD